MALRVDRSSASSRQSSLRWRWVQGLWNPRKKRALNNETYESFLLMDYAPVHYFPPNNGVPRGVGSHPHRGIETVTIAYKGKVEHNDSTGAGGVIEEGGVQWMTSGQGDTSQGVSREKFQ